MYWYEMFGGRKYAALMFIVGGISVAALIMAWTSREEILVDLTRHILNITLGCFVMYILGNVGVKVIDLIKSVKGNGEKK